MQRILSKKGIEVFKILPLSHISLNTKTQPLQFPIQDQDEDIINLMVDTLRASEIPSIALAANQVGFMKSVFVSGLSPHNLKRGSYNSKGYLTKLSKVEIIINPSIKYSENMVLSEEVCLSLPDKQLKIMRSQSIEMIYYNIFGVQMIIKCQGNEAFVYQHEFDHLEGVSLEQKAVEISENTQVYQ